MLYISSINMITSGSAPDDVKCHQSHSHIGNSVASCPAPPQTVHASLTPTHVMLPATAGIHHAVQ